MQRAKPVKKSPRLFPLRTGIKAGGVQVGSADSPAEHEADGTGG